MPIEKRDANLALLQSELTALQGAIRGLDTISFQVKGWAITVLLGITAFAAQQHRWIYPLIGLVATTGFALVDAQFRRFFFDFVQKNEALEIKIATVGIEAFLDSDVGRLGGATSSKIPFGSPFGTRLSMYLQQIWRVFRQPSFSGLYLFLAVMQVSASVLLLVS